jgi:hypothetical protein
MPTLDLMPLDDCFRKFYRRAPASSTATPRIFRASRGQIVIRIQKKPPRDSVLC